MDIESYYQRILTELEAGHRALIRYQSQELADLKAELALALKGKDDSLLKKIFCLVDHSAADDSGFGPLLLKALGQDLSPEILVFALNCARKHIIQSSFKKGQRLKFDFLEALKKLLYSPHPEVVEWALRTIEECGAQGVYFLKDLDKIKPPPWKWFNSHQRAVREIITMLERRWGRFEKP